MNLVETAQAPTSEGAEAAGVHPRSTLDHARLALLVFLAVEVGMLVTVLVLARHQWFTTDEWDLLASRTAGNVGDLLRPHFGQLTTVPVLVYRGLFNVFGLRTYLPYQLITLLLHLTAAGLLRVIMRRAGVGPWIATAAASLFALFGAGYQEIIWAAGIGLGGSLVLGLTQLILANHDGPIDRRDWLGLVAGVLGLLCSAVAVSVALAVGMTTLVRRGWRAAVFHTLPLAVLYAAWWVGYGRRYSTVPSIRGNLGLLARWVGTGVSSGFDAIGQLPGMGVALAVLLVVGLALAWGPLDRSRLRTQAAAPAALLISAFIFVVMSGWKEVVRFGPDYASSPHYLYIFVAMTVPAIGVAAYAIARRWWITFPVVLASLLIGIPGNLQILASPPGTWSPTFQTGYRQYLLSLTSSPVAHAVPHSTRPDPYQGFIFAPGVNIGWLLDQQRAGRLPDPGPVSSRTKADATLHLSLQQHAGHLPTSSAPARSTAPLVLSAKNPRLGTILVDNTGMTLYTLYAGTRAIPCTGACRKLWSPVTVPAGTKAPTGGPGVIGLSSGPSREVSYWEYPLYRYTGDKAPGDANGNAIRANGGAWHIIRLGRTMTCSRLVEPVARRLQKGQSIGIEGGEVGIIYYSSQGPSHLMRYNPAYGNTLVATTGPLNIHVQPLRPGEHLTLCQ